MKPGKLNKDEFYKEPSEDSGDSEFDLDYNEEDFDGEDLSHTNIEPDLEWIVEDGTYSDDISDEDDENTPETDPQDEFPEEPPGSEIFDDSDRKWDYDNDHEK